MEENEEAWELITRLSSQVRVGGLGEFVGTDIVAFDTLCSYLGIPEEDRITLWTKVEAVDEVKRRIADKERRKRQAIRASQPVSSYDNTSRQVPESGSTLDLEGMD